MVVMNKNDEVNVRKVVLYRNEYNTELTIDDYEFGLKLLDTFPVVDTGNVLTKAPEFGYVYLK